MASGWVAVRVLLAVGIASASVGGQTASSDPPPVVTGPATTLSAASEPTDVSLVTLSDSAPFAPTLEPTLDGQVPGATIESSAGSAPGRGLAMLLRGVTTINGSNQPLYIVDGVIVMNQLGSTATGAGGTASAEGNGDNRTADLNPEDIASIAVLKGPAATAIYGSKAAAGAVIITTKRGTPGAPRWSIDGEVGHALLANQVATRRFPTLASAQQWYLNDVTHDTAAAAISKDNAFIQSVYAGPQNYQTQLFGNAAASYAADVSVSGTAGQTAYFASALSRYANGVLLNTGDNKQSLRGNVVQQLGGSLSLAVNLDYVTDVTRQGGTPSSASLNPYEVMAYTPAFLELDHQDASGTWAMNPFGLSNPFADEVEISAPANTSRVTTGGSATWTPWRTMRQSLTIDITGGLDHAGLHDLWYAPPTLQSEQATYTGLPGTAITNDGNVTYTNYSGSVVHHYGDGPWLDATTAVGYQNDHWSNTNPITVAYNLVNGSTAGSVLNRDYYASSAEDQELYAQEQVLTLASRLAITAGVTADASNLDGNTQRFYLYPHYAASYRIPLFTSAVDEIKLRAAYGQAGEAPPYGARYVPDTSALIGGSGGIPPSGSTSGSSGVKPETARETELGIDLDLFNARAQLSATVYQKRMSDLYPDGGVLSDQGAELGLQVVPVALRNGFTWTSTTTFYRNYSVVDELPIPGYYLSQANFGGSYLAIGRSVTEIVAPTETGPDGLPVQRGDALPGYEMSFGEALTFRRFRIAALADWSRGGSTVDYTALDFDLGPQLSGDSTLSAQRRAALDAGGAPYIESTTFFTLRQVTLSYDVPTGIVRDIGLGRLTSARLTLSGFDLWSTFSYRGPDPQAEEFAGGQGFLTFAPTPYPPARSYYVGLRLGL